MLQLPVTPIAPQADALSPVSRGTGLPTDGAADEGSLIERLLTRAQDAQDASTQQLSQHLDQLDSGRISTSDLLRLQADMGSFAVRVQMTVRVADEAGRAIQTLSQRS
ncbi:acyl carrier protein [Paraburkholderia sp. FT54]|uniref:acyl carrier protein n=1 Tax=Paraburkholderia sp. FT54 TaxID=3074437 RepID=UPI002877A9BB|nr:acyl carrier protein [Paraburkholderia sp. FT54]WNC88604.1 acyl carrier protein [Paraburkholderia sp. FT54]